ncbi:MAG: ABC transporter permease subunit [Anaerolineae bacterium]|nr:ABC transporter permease subunit [Anaerolineae bacterium]
MNIFVRELKANLRSLFIWGVIVILFVWVGISKFSAYYNNPEMLAILDSMPPALVTAFNFQAFNLTTVSGFFGVMFTYYALMLSIAAAMWGSDIISKEERDKTVEFSLTLPVARSRVVTAKALAALVNCIGLLLITLGASLVSTQRYQPDGEFYGFLALCMLALFIMQLIFLAVGIFLGCAMKRYKRAGAVAVSLLLGTYFLSVISGLNKNLDFLKYFSPFKYFDAGMLLRESRLDLTFVGLSIAIVVVSMVGAYLTYARRDLYI